MPQSPMRPETPRPANPMAHRMSSLVGVVSCLLSWRATIFFRRRTCKPGGRSYASTRTHDHVSDASGEKPSMPLLVSTTHELQRELVVILEVRTWRRRSMHQGRVGFKSPMGRPAAGPLSTFPKKLKETILHLRKLYPGSGPNTLLAALKMDVYWGNQHLPSRALSHQAPLEAYPHAIHSGCIYRPEWEEDLLCLENVWTYLGACRWFRRIRTNGFFCLGGFPTTLASMLFISVWLFALMLILLRSSANLKEVKRLFKCQLKGELKRT